MATASEKRTAVVTAHKTRLKKNVYTNDTNDPVG